MPVTSEPTWRTRPHISSPRSPPWTSPIARNTSRKFSPPASIATRTSPGRERTRRPGVRPAVSRARRPRPGRGASEDPPARDRRSAPLPVRTSRAASRRSAPVRDIGPPGRGRAALPRDRLTTLPRRGRDPASAVAGCPLPGRPPCRVPRARRPPEDDHLRDIGLFALDGSAREVLYRAWDLPPTPEDEEVVSENAEGLRDVTLSLDRMRAFEPGLHLGVLSGRPARGRGLDGVPGEADRPGRDRVGGS